MKNTLILQGYFLFDAGIFHGITIDFFFHLCYHIDRNR
jgi:hypothetical protein